MANPGSSSGSLKHWGDLPRRISFTKVDIEPLSYDALGTVRLNEGQLLVSPQAGLNDGF